jgi:hypothetical protein
MEGMYNPLENVIFGNNVKIIKDESFAGFNTIRHITFGCSLEEIGSRAFAGYDNLESVTCKSVKVPKAHRTAFENSYIDYVTLYVPEESVEDYKATAPWSGFKNIVGKNTTLYTLTYIVDGEVYKSVTYEEGDVVSPEPEPQKEGYAFSGWSEIPKNMPASDVTVTGSFTEAPLEKLPAPSVNILGNEIVFSCEAENVEYHYDINHLDVKSGEGNNIKLVNTYRISVYVSKEGYRDSDVTTKDIYLPSGGDANGDGALNAADIVYITNMIMNKKND